MSLVIEHWLFDHCLYLKCKHVNVQLDVLGILLNVNQQIGRNTKLLRRHKTTLSYLNHKHDFEWESLKDHQSNVWLNFEQWFQRRRFKCEKIRMYNYKDVDIIIKQKRWYLYCCVKPHLVHGCMFTKLESLKVLKFEEMFGKVAETVIYNKCSYKITKLEPITISILYNKVHFVRSIAGNVDQRVRWHELIEANDRGQVMSLRVPCQGFSFPAIDLSKSN